MRTVDLSHCAHNDDGVDFGGTLPSQEWWNNYLAWLASTPRNWIERRLEPLVQEPGSHVRIIDVETPEEAGVQNGYPTASLDVWWVILCMDGAPERMGYQVKSCRQSLDSARHLLAPAEARFRSLMTAELVGGPNQPVVQVLGDWRDGIIVGYETESAARDAISRTSQTLASINDREKLPWNWQFHIRAGLGRSIRDAFTALLRARRGQVVPCAT